MPRRILTRRNFLAGTVVAGAGGAVIGPLGGANASAGPDFYVTNAAELDTAIASAGPGSTITMRNGTWNNLEISIGASARNGSSGAPIVLRAETGGQVVLTGLSRLAIGRDRWIVDGLAFRNGYSTELVRPIDFRADSSNVAHYSTIRNIAIENFNPPDDMTRYEWVFLRGHHNRITHCYFSGKTHLRDLIGGEPLSGTATSHLIDHNYIGDIPEPDPVGNGHGACTPVYGNYYLESDNNVVEHNVFRNCNGEDEIVSLKSSGNTVRHNTFLNCGGYISLRHGNSNDVYSNYVFGGSSDGGIRFQGENQRIYNNYFAGLWRGVIILNGADAGNYGRVRNAEIVNNTFVNTVHRAFTVGGIVNGGTGNLPPGSFMIANNIVWTGNGEMIDYVTTPINPSYQGNIMYDAPLGISNPGGISQVDPQMQAQTGDYTVYVPSSSSPAIDAATGAYVYLDEDIEGKGRPAGSDSDVGAHEASGDPVIYPPLTVADVGPDYMTIT